MIGLADDYTLTATLIAFALRAADILRSMAAPADPPTVPPRGLRLPALAAAAHPLPTAAVTVVLTALTAAAGSGPGRTALFAAAVFTGQLSIGWSNDALDATRDHASERRDKPVATGELGVRQASLAATAAIALTVPLSLLLGLPAGLAHLGAVACGWAYNLGLKSSARSWLPYAVGFGLFPSAAVLASPGSPAPAWWLVTAGATLGVAAHIANVLPDLDDDAATGVRGLPHRLGYQRGLRATAVLLLAATGSLAAGLWSQSRVVALAALAVSLAASVLVVARRASSSGPPLAFRVVLAVAAMDVGLLLAIGASL